jgi:hypothetical protein
MRSFRSYCYDMPRRFAIFSTIAALAAALGLLGCAEEAAILQLERQTLASLCTTDCPSSLEAADRGCAEARELGLTSEACSTTVRCAEGPTLVSVGRTAGTAEAAEQWWFDLDGHVIASRHCRPDGMFDLCVHYGPDLACSGVTRVETPG